MRVARRACETDVYHVFARGVGRQLIFEDDEDRFLFLDLMSRFSALDGVSFIAWALMDNHFHLLLRAPLPAISKFMARLESAYATAFNGRHDRVGHLFQGRFGSQGIDSDKRLLAAVRYIHQNPLKVGMSSGCLCRWSSYGEYVGAPYLCDTDMVWGFFSDLEDFEAFHAIAETDRFADVDDEVARATRLSDRRAEERAEELFGVEWRLDLSHMGKEDRDARLRELKKLGLSVRQLERLTGIGRGVIQRC